MKFSADALFKERVAAYYKEVRKYTRYMLNDHLLFVLVFALGAVLYYYSGWVETIDESFPAPFIIAAVMAIVLFWSPVYTYIKRPDTVYLLPLEKQMKSYFQKAVWTSLAAQSYVLVALLVFAMPMYAASQQAGFNHFFLFFGALFAAKIWNLFCRLSALNMPSAHTRSFDASVRLLLNFIFMFAVFSIHYAAAGFAALSMFFWLIYISRAGKRPLKWELLAELEEKRLASFYRIANLFTDVPHLRGTVKRRAWLDSLLPGPKSGTDLYLLFRTFIRMDEYFGLYLRLTVIGALIILFSGLMPVQLIIALLFLYLTGFQLLSITGRHDHVIWPKLYPAGESKRPEAVQQLLQRILVVQSVLFGVAAAINGSVVIAGMVLGSSIAFTIVFVNMYVPARLRKKVGRV